MPSLNALRAETEVWLEELGRARAQAAPGAARLAAVDAAHPEVVSPETARAVRALLGSSRLPEHELPRLRTLVRFLETASLEAAAREGHSAPALAAMRCSRPLVTPITTPWNLAHTIPAGGWSSRRLIRTGRRWISLRTLAKR